MFELLALVAFILALIVYRGGRSRFAALEREISVLREDMRRLQAGEPPLSSDRAAMLPAPHETPPARKTILFKPTVTGVQVFGGDGHLAQEAVEKAARGEPATVKPRETETPPQPAKQPAERKESLESRLGARWAVWVGGLALALGGIFMVKYSIDAGLISPAVRLVLATVFGVLLVTAGEVVRRRAVPLIATGFANAMIPGVLTAAGVVTLLGVVYAAYDIYGFIGPATAFTLLAVVSLGAVGLSLLHGQSLAGLGLLASLVTPLLFAADTPSPGRLFGFLLIVWVATLAASRMRGWRIVPSIANVGLGLWAMIAMGTAAAASALPVTLTMLAMIAGTAFAWRGWMPVEPTPAEAETESTAAEAASAASPSPDTPLPGPGSTESWRDLFLPPLLPVMLTCAVSAILAALVLISPDFAADAKPQVVDVILILAALAAFGALDRRAAAPAILSALGALCCFLSLLGPATTVVISEIVTPVIPDGSDMPIATAPALDASAVLVVGMILSAMLLAAGALAVWRWVAPLPRHAILWSVIMVATPVLLTGMSFLMLGNFTFDAPHGLFALAAGAMLIGLAELVSRRRPAGLLPVQAILVAGSLMQFALALHAMTDGLWTTMLLSALGAVYVFSTRFRPWPVMPWMMVVASLGVLARIAYDPSIVGAASLGTTPVFNALLAGYGVPALLLGLSAYGMRVWPDIKARNVLQALACLFALLTAAILVRHAMNGGRLDSSVPTLAEQSIYTLIVIGASAIMMILDRKSPGSVLRYGSMLLGILSMLSVLTAHLVGLNPYLTGEGLGPYPLVDLLLIGYLLPGLAYAGLAFLARDRRPVPYVAALAVSGAVLVFSWATLVVRRVWQGENIADWKGFLQGETYTYSVVWLILGVVMLWLGSRFSARGIRIASAVLVFVAVLKVFLVDMSHLEGFLRALSFIGLGGVLIGIGLFYQKILSAGAGTDLQAPSEPQPEPATDAEPVKE